MKTYKKDKIQLQHNNKTGEAGTIDLLRGCNGCEISSVCYAAKGARRLGIDFFQPIRREFDKSLLEKQLKRYKIDWVRIGCISDPSLDWKTTLGVVKLVRKHNKTPVVITKAFETPSDQTLEDLGTQRTHLQISVCGFTPAEKVTKRKLLALEARQAGLRVSWRINSGEWKEGSKPQKVQSELINFARANKIPIIDTPLRMFQTSPFWKHVEQSKYHRHLSPISGKLDNQRAAGLIIPGAYACYSTCAEGPKDNDPVGCVHQCCTRV